MAYICEQLNDHACKTYLIALEGGSEAVLIDPVLEKGNDYVKLLEDRDLTLVKVIDTHTHADHISAGALLKDRTDCIYVMHKDAPARCPGFHVEDGTSWDLLGEIPVRVMHTPGHTRDSISLVLPDRIFTGDALFLDSGGAGRDDLPGGDAGSHWETLQRFRELPEDLLVYPAHDYRDRKPSSLGHQKESNPHLQERTREEFVAYLEDLKLGAADWMADVLKANYSCATDPEAAWIPADSPACEVKGTLDLGVNDIQVAAIPPVIVKQKIASESGLVLIDVREPAELEGDLGSIDGILNIPIGELTGRLTELEQFKSQEIITVCRSGGRAHTAAQILVKAGFPKVAVMSGGMLAW